MTRNKNVLLAITLVAGLSLAGVPAQAANVVVKFGLSAGTVLGTGVLCPVSVPAGSDGVVVLKAAKAKHCILSYRLTEFPGLGTFVECINGVCGTALTYWAMYENGTYTSYGVDLFQANLGDRLTFAYTTWLTCLTPKPIAWVISCDNKPWLPRL